MVFILNNISGDNMKDYLLFVDETKADKYHPNFCFAGMVVEREYYEKVLVRNVNVLKIKHFGRSDIIFHFSDMKKNRNDFSIFISEEKRDNFWTDYVKLLNDAKFNILGIYFDDKKMNELQYGVSKNNYNIGFYALLDNFMHYLKDNNAYGQICVESRSLNENRFLLDVFYRYQQSGSIYFTESEVKKHLSSIGFIVKGDNCIGLQLVDPVPSQLMRYIAQNRKDFYNLYNTLSTKIYNVGTEFESILGIKNIL